MKLLENKPQKINGNSKAKNNCKRQEEINVDIEKNQDKQYHRNDYATKMEIGQTLRRIIS